VVRIIFSDSLFAVESYSAHPAAAWLWAWLDIIGEAENRQHSKSREAKTAKTKTEREIKRS